MERWNSVFQLIADSKGLFGARGLTGIEKEGINPTRKHINIGEKNSFFDENGHPSRERSSCNLVLNDNVKAMAL